MKVYATKTFRRFQRKEGIADAALVAAVDRADAGMIDADLGGGLIKRGRVGEKAAAIGPSSPTVPASVRSSSMALARTSATTSTAMS